MGKKITERVTWVGKTDWNLESFHGTELSTHRGSSYNAYLVRGDQKTVLIDTVWGPYDREFVSRLKEEIDLHQIDAIIMNHNETDHSGALMELLALIPGTPIYCTAKGEGILRGMYHQDWNYHNVKTGDTLDLGGVTLTFIEASMLHWPDTMFSYLSGENILFSNDGFGQHYASEHLYADECPAEEVLWEAEKYYANILAIYSKQVTQKINEILAMNLPLSMICPSHGVIWRKNPEKIIEQYLLWADNYQENQITIVYDTMWNATRIMAESIAEGIREADPDVTVKLFCTGTADKNDISTEVFRSKAILLGSPTVNYGILSSVAEFLELLKGMHLHGKKAAAFGSYGWSGKTIVQLADALKKAGFEIVDEGHQSLWQPDEAEIQALRAYGRQFAEEVR